MSYTGCYINLDRSADRRAVMEAQLARLGLGDRYRRFAAADGNVLGFSASPLTPGEIGCFTSHYLVLKENLDCPTHLHVLEDDAVLSRFTDSGIRYIVSSGFIDNFDLLFLDSAVHPRSYRNFKELYDKSIERDAAGNAVSVRLNAVEYLAATTSYLVNRGATRKLLASYEDMIAKGLRHPIDLALRELAPAAGLRIGCVFPFVTTVRLDEPRGTIGGRRNDPPTAAALQIPRRAFFVDCDIRALCAYADQVLPEPTSDPRARLISRVVDFIMSPEFLPF